MHLTARAHSLETVIQSRGRASLTHIPRTGPLAAPLKMTALKEREAVPAEHFVKAGRFKR